MAEDNNDRDLNEELEELEHLRGFDDVGKQATLVLMSGATKTITVHTCTTFGSVVHAVQCWCGPLRSDQIHLTCSVDLPGGIHRTVLVNGNSDVRCLSEQPFGLNQDGTQLHLSVYDRLSDIQGLWEQPIVISCIISDGGRNEE